MRLAVKNYPLEVISGFVNDEVLAIFTSKLA
jgi:hypothetical protein